MKQTSFASWLVTLVIAFGFAAPVGAQTTGGGGAGAGTGTTPGGPPAPSRGNEIDLPIGAPVTGIEDVIPPDPVETDTDGPQLYDEDLPTESSSIIYVLDVSGSMDWGSSSYTGLDGNPTSGTKLDRAKTELARSVLALTEDFKFNIIAYDCSMRRWNGASQSATAAAKASASGWVGGLRAGGATGTGPAGALGLQDKENFTVVVLSDGSPNCGANGFSGHRSMISSANSQGAVVHTFGIAATGQFEGFLRGIADDSGGRYFSVP